MLWQIRGRRSSGYGNTLGPGKQAGDAWSSRGEPQLVASQECNVARGEDHNVVCVGLRQQNLEEFFLQSGRLAIACFFICSPLGHSLLLHFFFSPFGHNLLLPRDFVVTLHCSPLLCHIALL